MVEGRAEGVVSRAGLRGIKRDEAGFCGIKRGGGSVGRVFEGFCGIFRERVVSGGSFRDFASGISQQRVVSGGIIRDFASGIFRERVVSGVIFRSLELSWSYD